MGEMGKFFPHIQLLKFATGHGEFPKFSLSWYAGDMDTVGNGHHSLQQFDDLKSAGFSEEQARAILQTASWSSASKADLEVVKIELQRDIEIVKRDVEAVRTELKRDIEIIKRDVEAVRTELKKDIEIIKRDVEAVRTELKRDIETVRAELKKDIEIIKRDIKELETRLSLKMVITSGSFAVFILSSLVVLAKLGLLSPPLCRKNPIVLYGSTEDFSSKITG